MALVTLGWTYRTRFSNPARDSNVSFMLPKVNFSKHHEIQNGGMLGTVVVALIAAGIAAVILFKFPYIIIKNWEFQFFS